MLTSLVEIDLTTILSLVYGVCRHHYRVRDLGFSAGALRNRRVAPLSLLVPVVGLASAAILLDES